MWYRARDRFTRRAVVYAAPALLAAAAMLLATAAIPASAESTSATFRTVGSGIGCDGSPGGDGGAATSATVTLTREDNVLTVGLDLAGLPAQTYSVEVFEATGGCGSDDDAAVGSAAGGVSSTLTLSVPHPTLGGETLGDGAGSERAVVVLDRFGSGCGCGDAYVAVVAVPVAAPPSPSPTASPGITPTPSPEPEPPQARFDIAAQPGNRTATFDASASTPANTIVRYAWDFDGDGSTDSAGSSPNATHTYPRAGQFTVNLIVTDDRDRIAAAVRGVTIVDRYRVELKSWIPHTATADPFILSPTVMPNLLIPLMGQPLRSCFQSVADSTATGYVTVLSSSFHGDGHQGFGVTGEATNGPVLPDSRIATVAEFDWDGSAVTNLVDHRGSGTTTRRVSIRGPRGTATCAQTGHADRSVNPGARVSGAGTVTVGVKGGDPLTPTDVAAAARQAADAICRVATANPTSVTVALACTGGRLAAQRIPAIPITPTLDGQVSVALAGTDPVLSFTSDLFPSYGVAVTRNATPLGTSVFTDASCIAGSGYPGAANVMVGLQTILGQQRTGTLPPYTNRACQPLPQIPTQIVAQLLTAINAATEPATIIMVSNVPPS
jgi:hypothetical protein